MNVPDIPLATGDLIIDVEIIFRYLQRLADYFANYTPTITTETGIIPSIAPITERSWPDASTTNIAYYFQIPENYTSGDITLRLIRHSATTGTAVMTWDATRIRKDASVFTIIAPTSINLVVTANIINETVLTVPSSNIIKGDILRIGIERIGADAGDTLAGTVLRHGLTASYAAKIRLP